MIDSNQPPKRSDLGPLIVDCLVHLDTEEKALRETLNTLYLIRRALMQRNQDLLMDGRKQQDELARANAKITMWRGKLRERIAQVLCVPVESANLSALARHADEQTRQQVTNRQEQLGQMAMEAELIGRANAALIQRSVQFLQDILMGLTGNRSNHCYDPNGKIRSGGIDPLLQEEC